MSSWLSAQPTQRRRLGFHQKFPEGNFIKKEKPATVVSAYYDMKSKYDTASYRKWLKLFLEHLECHLVFFTDKTLAPFVEECRKGFEERTKVIVLEREEWVANTAFPSGFWENQYSLDPEKAIHSPELYKVWYEKKEFVRRAIEMNPFDHDDFVWTDAGIVRVPEVAELVSQFYPVADRIPTDRILIMNINPFTHADETDVNIGAVTIRGGRGRHRIGAGVIAAKKELWTKYITIYDEVVEKYRVAKYFLGKEQILMATIALENKNIISLLDAREIVPNDWIYLFLYLGVAPSVFELFRVPDTKKRKYTYETLLRISSQKN